MTLTYKNDDSFFIVIVPKMNIYQCWPVYKWLLQLGNAKFRVIHDHEVEADRLTLTEVQKIYPGIGSIGIVMNPWTRVVSKFQKMQETPELLVSLSDKFPRVDFTNFESVLSFFKDCTVESAALLPQLHWLRYESPGGIVQSNYIIRGEYAEEDSKAIQEYFCCEDKYPVSFSEFGINPLEYKDYYNSTTQKIVADFFEEDINTFKYTF
jgi:hypothetical protein